MQADKLQLAFYIRSIPIGNPQPRRLMEQSIFLLISPVFQAFSNKNTPCFSSLGPRDHIVD